VPQRLPNAPESRVLLALYHKGPLTKTALINLEAVSMSSHGHLLSLVEKTLVMTPDDRTYQLTKAGYDLCELCLRYDLMIETNYRSDPLTRQVARRSEVLQDFLEGDFRVIHHQEGNSVAVTAPQGAPESPAAPPLPPSSSPSPRAAAPVVPPPPIPVTAAPVVTPPVTPKPTARAARAPMIIPRVYSSVPRK
jgi:hypothetical protein